MAKGTAMPKAQGQDITITARENVIAFWMSPVLKNQSKKTKKDRAITNCTK
jgi:hypothetical protein